MGYSVKSHAAPLAAGSRNVNPHLSHHVAGRHKCQGHACTSVFGWKPRVRVVREKQHDRAWLTYCTYLGRYPPTVPALETDHRYYQLWSIHIFDMLPLHSTLSNLPTNDHMGADTNTTLVVITGCRVSPSRTDQLSVAIYRLGG